MESKENTTEAVVTTEMLHRFYKNVDEQSNQTEAWLLFDNDILFNTYANEGFDLSEALKAALQRTSTEAVASSRRADMQSDARMTEEVVEAAARAAYEDWIDPVRCAEPTWGELPESHKLRLFSSQRAALATLPAEPVMKAGMWADFIAWLDQQRDSIGAVDGYDYRSGEEYGLRRAQIEAERRAALTVPQPDPVPTDKELLLEAWGALNFILAFYEPGQTYLDTNAWKLAEASGRRVHKKLRERLDVVALHPSDKERDR